ncbi:hypothetical protein ACTNDN_15240 [Niallia sp. HCP3S3_B10]|jgi:hypothetical protein|uniref:Uncharacterized protein n=2 Tax=Niallia TaxID=2837506 RepID=A0ABV1F8W1_9BACI|nr:MULTISPECIES: hypothetical protein [Bacillaceae]MCM3363450.1 hypothetical protein [Niallia sp. MER TA 168]CAI9395098.1 hypothetical protein BACSP_00862 [Bacillus sp. T2.9-1]
MLSEIVETLIILWAGKDISYYPTEEQKNQNLKLLRNEQWFKDLFSEHTELFLKNKKLRHFIGAVNPQIILANPKKKKRFEEDLIYLIKIIEKHQK